DDRPFGGGEGPAGAQAVAAQADGADLGIYRAALVVERGTEGGDLRAGGLGDQPLVDEGRSAVAQADAVVGQELVLAADLVVERGAVVKDDAGSSRLAQRAGVDESPAKIDLSISA